MERSLRPAVRIVLKASPGARQKFGERTAAAPLWVSGDEKHCRECNRETSWLDIVSSALEQVHRREMIARVILGEQKFVNTEAPRAIEGVKCYDCGGAIENLRSFKCHNWAYAKEAMLEVLQKMEATNPSAESPDR